MSDYMAPDRCAECGTRLTEEIVAAGDAGPLAVSVRGHALPVPGLYVCAPCAGAIMIGERQPRVTWEAARNHLAALLPRVAEHLLVVLKVAQEAQDMYDALELAIAARDGGLLDSIPECQGGQEPHKSHLN